MPRLRRVGSLLSLDLPKTRAGHGVRQLKDGGADGTRTHDNLLAKQELYQLSYDPVIVTSKFVSKVKFEVFVITPIPPATGRRNAACLDWLRLPAGLLLPKGGDPAAGSPTATLLRLHPSRRRRLGRLAAASAGADSHDVTGGVYKARERIQGAVADAPLLAIPTSCSRVADCSPNWGRLWGIRTASRPRLPLYRPL